MQRLRAARMLTDFDSSVNMVRALGRFFRGRGICTDDIAHWVTSQYGQGPYAAVVVGSPSGGAVHLAAALGAPFLPQTTLVAVRDVDTHPDDAVGAMHALAPTTALIARNNPEVSVYHIHDPAQDRPMLQAMAYMRLKRRRLGREYERFLEERLAPGATVIQLESTREWRSREVAERAYFQFGCLGGVPRRGVSRQRRADHRIPRA